MNIPRFTLRRVVYWSVVVSLVVAMVHRPVRLMVDNSIISFDAFFFPIHKIFNLITGGPEVRYHPVNSQMACFFLGFIVALAGSVLAVVGLFAGVFAPHGYRSIRYLSMALFIAAIHRHVLALFSPAMIVGLTLPCKCLMWLIGLNPDFSDVEAVASSGAMPIGFVLGCIPLAFLCAGISWLLQRLSNWSSFYE